jgi:hypothetical protein
MFLGSPLQLRFLVTNCFGRYNITFEQQDILCQHLMWKVDDYFFDELEWKWFFWVATESRQMKPQTIDCFRQQNYFSSKKMLNWKFSFPILRPWLNPVSCLLNANQMLPLESQLWEKKFYIFLQHRSVNMTIFLGL